MSVLKSTINRVCSVVNWQLGSIESSMDLPVMN